MMNSLGSRRYGQDVKAQGRSLFSAMMLLSSCLAALLSLSGCGGKVAGDPRAGDNNSVLREVEIVRAPDSVPMWLGNPARSFYGTGPWPEAPLEVIWEFETKWTTGRFHKDRWGGSAWPGQPAVIGERVYVGAADGYIYCLDARDGSVIWSYKTLDSQKASPAVDGERLVGGGLDHHVYCLDARDGSLIWKYKTDFEVDSSPAIIGERVYFGGEDGFFYCLKLEDGALVYKQPLGSVEGSFTVVDGRIYVGTEEGDLYCLNLEDGAIIWKVAIGADSDSTPAVADGLVYTAAEDGYVSCFKQSNGELVWKFQADGSLKPKWNRYTKRQERGGFWASPIISEGRVYIGSDDKTMYCLTASSGELIWRYQTRGPVWGTSPVVDGRVVFGDKAGWTYMLSAEDGKLIWEMQIGENINATPAIVGGRIYVGAFNGKFYCLGAGDSSEIDDLPR